MQRTVLVTGGLGFIGSHTVVELIKSGYKAIILDDCRNSDIRVLDQIETIAGLRPKHLMYDYGQTDSYVQELKAEAIDSVIHFAANKAVGESVSLPLKYYTNNVSSMISFMKIVEELEINNFIFSSSCTVYGEPDQNPINELAPIKPAQSTYGRTKQIGEGILDDLNKSGANLKIISLRYFNPVGAHESHLIGELPIGMPNNLMPVVTKCASGQISELEVFGDNYDTIDGTCIRDYIHVQDLARAHVMALGYANGLNSARHEVINIGTGNGYSVLEVIKAFEKVNDIKLAYRIGERRPGDIEKIYADPTKANQLLGWYAEKGLEDMVKDSWQFEVNRPFR